MILLRVTNIIYEVLNTEIRNIYTLRVGTQGDTSPLSKCYVHRYTYLGNFTRWEIYSSDKNCKQKLTFSTLRKNSLLLTDLVSNLCVHTSAIKCQCKYYLSFRTLGFFSLSAFTYLRPLHRLVMVIWYHTAKRLMC